MTEPEAPEEPEEGMGPTEDDLAAADLEAEAEAESEDGETD
jgi:hypothetical protein